jgi:ATP-dependent RNA helicase DDX18/HAS1
MLSFLVPSVALLEKHRFHTRHGTGVLIVTPDRETAVQITGLASELLAGTSHTVGMVIEGANRGAEEQKLDRGINLLVATPTKLLEHMRDVTSFIFKNMKAFFVYGATSLVEQGTQQQVREIISLIPKKGRTSGVFGNENVDGVEGLVELICRPDAVHVASTATGTTDTNASTQTQGYVLVEADKRFLLLHSFLKKFQRKRIVVLVSSTPGVLFCEEAFGSFDLPVHAIHGRQNSKARAAAFSDFVNDAEGTLICTEEAVQGLDVRVLLLHLSLGHRISNMNLGSIRRLGHPV